jgi:hypothetical protein
MVLVHGDDVVQQVTPAASHPTLRNSILPWALKGRPHRVHGHRSDRSWNLSAKLSITIKD